MALPPDSAAALDRLARFGTRLGLERMTALLAALGAPHRRLPAVLVAGTNGKGTVAALLSSFATAARYRTGLYTSPHLETVEERLRIDGRAIGSERLAELLERVLASAEENLAEPPTYFEALTACAVLWLAEEEVDLAVLEVGLGGRFDATNAVDPRLAVITPVALDHREHLGETIEEVAREKAGVMRPEIPVVVPPEAAGATSGAAAASVLAAEAERLGARRVPSDERVVVEAVQRYRPFSEPVERRQRVWLRPPLEEEPGVGGGSGAPAPLIRSDREASEVYELALSGRHQADNLALAVAAAGELRELGWDRLTPPVLKRGAKACRWPGRLEEVRLPAGRSGDGGRVLLDVAHNPAGTAALAEFLGTAFGPGEPVDLVFGVLSDKEPGPMLAALGERARRIVLTRPSGPRGMDVEELAAAVPEELGCEIAMEEEVERAVRRAVEGAGEGVVVVCGSVVLVGDARMALRRRWGVPEAAVDAVTGP